MAPFKTMFPPLDKCSKTSPGNAPSSHLGRCSGNPVLLKASREISSVTSQGAPLRFRSDFLIQLGVFHAYSFCIFPVHFLNFNFQFLFTFTSTIITILCFMCQGVLIRELPNSDTHLVSISCALIRAFTNHFYTFSSGWIRLSVNTYLII